MPKLIGRREDRSCDSTTSVGLLFIDHKKVSPFRALSSTLA